MEVINVSASRSFGASSDVSNGSPSRDFGSVIDNLANAYGFPSGRFDRVSIGRW
jgi:hypothetical protein